MCVFVKETDRQIDREREREREERTTECDSVSIGDSACERKNVKENKRQTFQDR